MKRNARFLAMALLTCTAAAFAAGGEAPERPTKPEDPAVEAARAAIAKNDWVGAQKGLMDALARNGQNADYHNLYAYSIRKGPNPAMDLVFRHYNEALRLNPKHLGAHEYLGEAYLMTGNVLKAREHLAQLDKLCTFGCEEYTALKKEVAAYEQQHAKK